MQKGNNNNDIDLNNTCKCKNNTMESTSHALTFIEESRYNNDDDGDNDEFVVNPLNVNMFTIFVVSNRLVDNAFHNPLEK